MFVAVWVLYAVDRLLDTRPLFSQAHAPELRARHHFHHRFRSRFLKTIVIACLLLVILLHRTKDALLHRYALLAVLLSIWLVLVHARPVPARDAHRLPKELAVGVFFPAAVFLPAISQSPALETALLPDALLFACLCSLNCLLLYAWEHEGNPTGHPHATTRWAVLYLVPIAAALCLLALLFASAASLTASSPALHMLAHPAACFLATAASAALLLTLHVQRRRLDPLRLRSLADLVLLTPLPVMAGVLVRRCWG